MMGKLYEIFLKHPSICTDTRKIEKDSIFFALKGPHFNANSFAKKAIEQGCSYAIIDEKKFKEGDNYILVDDVLTALQNLAMEHRKHLKIPVIGITGSNGKTTTKELTNAVLSKKFKTFATKGNLNNHIGVPLSILSVSEEIEIAIIEMGANHIGEIANLCAITQPDYGIITNIGKAHLEGFGSIEGVKKGKGELYDFLRTNNGTIFINYDNQILKDISSGIKKITYGKTEECDCIGKLIDANPFVKTSWKKKQDSEFQEIIQTRIVGSYNFENLLAAVCLGDFFGVKKSDIKSALENYLPSDNRSQILHKGSNTIILDCYNANPVSMSAAINNFAQINDGNKIAILGDMLELGEFSDQEHEIIIEIVKNCNFSQVILVGKEFSKTKLPEKFHSFFSTEEAKKFLLSQKPENSQILIKGSRGIKLENLAEVL